MGQADRWVSEDEGDAGVRPKAAVSAAGRTGGIKVQGQIKSPWMVSRSKGKSKIDWVIPLG